MSAAWYRETWRSALTAIAIVVPGALVLGGVTSFAQLYLPPQLASFANSSGGWTMLCFLLLWMSRARPLLGAILGAAAFVCLTEGYGIVSLWRGFYYAEPFSTQWTLLSLIAGPVIGAAACVCRYGRPLWRALAVTPLGAVLLGEGVWALVAVAQTTSPVYWSVQILLSALFIAVAVWRTHLRAPLALMVVGVWLAGAVVFFAAYSWLSG